MMHVHFADTHGRRSNSTASASSNFPGDKPDPLEPIDGSLGVRGAGSSGSSGSSLSLISGRPLMIASIYVRSDSNDSSDRRGSTQTRRERTVRIILSQSPTIFKAWGGLKCQVKLFCVAILTNALSFRMLAYARRKRLCKGISPKKIRVYHVSGWVGPGFVVESHPKIALNSILIFWRSIPCVFCWNIHLLKAVTYYGLSVLSMLVMGFQEKQFGWGWVGGWVGGVSCIQVYFGFLDFV